MLIPEPWEDRAGRNDDSDFLRYLSMFGFDHFLLCPSEESKIEALNILTGKSNFFFLSKGEKGGAKANETKDFTTKKSFRLLCAIETSKISSKVMVKKSFKILQLN